MGFAQGRSSRPDRGLASPEAPAARPAPRPPLIQWAPVHVHAFEGPDGIAVWVRDAKLEKAGREAMLKALRARLAAAGLRLDGLVVNGERTDGIDP
jgi:hypothetical protein